MLTHFRHLHIRNTHLYGVCPSLVLRSLLICAALCVGCQADDIGPRVDCREGCTEVVEPGAASSYRLQWHEEPCDSESKYLGPLLSFCTDVDIIREILCDGPCEVVESLIDDEVRDITPLQPGPLTFTVRLTRIDTGEIYEEAHSIEVGLADRFELECENDCRVISGSPGLPSTVRIRAKAFAGERRVTVNWSNVATTPSASFQESESGRYIGHIPVQATPSVLSLVGASGASASIALPGSH